MARLYCVADYLEEGEGIRAAARKRTPVRLIIGFVGKGERPGGDGRRGRGRTQGSGTETGLM